jgi:hypothetical protein
MSVPAIRVTYSVANKLKLSSRQRFSWENQQLIARARAGCFGGVYNPGRVKSVAKGLRHNADQYRAHLRDLTSRHADSWRPIPPEFQDNTNFRDKGIMKKINALLKANNTYQTPKK